MATASSDLLRIPEAAKRLAVSEAHLRNMIDRGEIDAIHVGRPNARRRTWRISVAAMDAFLAERTDRVSRKETKPRRRMPSMAARRRAAGLE